MELREVAEELEQKGEVEINIAELLDLESAQIIHEATKRKRADSYSLLYFFFRRARDMDVLFYRMLLDKRQALRDLKQLLPERPERQGEPYSKCFQKTIESALIIARRRGNERIEKWDLFTALSEHNDYLKELLYQADMNTEDVYNLTSWQRKLGEKENPWLYKNLLKRGSIAREWAFGYTPLLDKFSRGWNDMVRQSRFIDTVGHAKEIESLERVLARKEVNSVVLVGEPGVGRKSIVRELVKRSMLGKSFDQINNMRFLELNLASVLAQAEGEEETEKTLDELFREAARARNVILIIDNLHDFVGREKRPGVLNISGILEPYLHLPNFRVIGITSFMGFRGQVESSSSILPLLEKVESREITEEETLILLQRKALSLEKNYRKLISYASLKETISLSARYMQDSPLPEKALNLLEEAVVHADQKGEGILSPSHIAQIVTEKAEVPVGEIDAQEKEKLLNMEELLHEKIVNQELAVRAVSAALRRSRADVDTRKGLIGGFLFLGPTGVGKTEMAKAIASIYFGTEKKMHRIDMSEFQSISDISRLIGSTTEKGVLTSRVREDPFSLVLLDELEKAHPDILNLFLQILDEGHVTDGVGRKINFRNCLLIATSNAGYQIILEAIEKKMDWGEVKERILKKLFQESMFRPEFVNRFDEVVIFKPLGKKELIAIAGMQLEKMAQGFAQKDIEFIVTDELKEKIVELSYDPVFGAREMQRAMQNNIGDALASTILRGELQKGDRFRINPEGFNIVKE